MDEIVFVKFVSPTVFLGKIIPNNPKSNRIFPGKGRGDRLHFDIFG